MKVKIFWVFAVIFTVLCCSAYATQESMSTNIPVWEFGYMSGYDGSQHQNKITARTKDIIHLTNMSYIKVNDANVTVAVMKYVDSKWDSMITPSLTTRSGKLIFSDPMDVRLNYSYKGNPVIRDLSIPNDAITIYIPDSDTQLGALNGKTVAWFGTSISAGDGANLQPPIIVGEAIGATIYNEAVGSSGVRAGNYRYSSDNDPKGYGGIYYESLMRSLSLSSVEKQVIYDRWDKWKDIIPDAPESIPEGKIEFYKRCSWDVKLSKYLTGGNVGHVDYYVFEHGHNDAGLGYIYDDLSSYPKDEFDRTYFIGAMNFIFEKIYSDNPDAKIILIGHYEDARKKGISIAQIELSNEWNIPLCRTWEKLDWTQDVVAKDGVSKTITQWLMPDDLHPHSDLSGEATRQYSDALIDYFKNIK